LLNYLLVPLAPHIGFLRLFGYISFRAAGAAVTALLLTFIVGPVIIGALRRNRIALDQPVPQLIYTDDATFPRRRNYVGQLAAALADAASSHLVSVYGGVLWLTPPRGQ